MPERIVSARSLAGQTLVQMKKAAAARGDLEAERLLRQRIRCFRIASQLYRR
jgi:hypothetical protein